MAKTCYICKVTYKTKKRNFSKDKYTKDKYCRGCKSCLSKQKKDWMDNLSSNEAERIKLINQNSLKKHRKSGKHIKAYENYKEIRNKRDRENRYFERLARGIVSYEAKLRWQEEQFYIGELLICEL